MLSTNRPTLLGKHCLPGTVSREYISFRVCLYFDHEADIVATILLIGGSVSRTASQEPHCASS